MRSNDSNNYKIERIDLRGIESDIPRNDIFLETDVCHLKDTKVSQLIIFLIISIFYFQWKEGSFALIKYPDDTRHCLCPSIILRHDKKKTKVRFYDCFEKEDMDNNQIAIPITEQQFEWYTKIRIEKENSLVNQVTVGLNDQTNTFMLGKRIKYFFL